MSAATLTDHEVELAVLAAADELFYRRGIAAVSMAEIRDLSGVSMRRLYGFANSKTDLVSRWLEHRHVSWTDGFFDRIARRQKEGEPLIDAIFHALADWMEQTDYRGCGFINTHAESSELADEHRVIIRMHKQALADRLSELDSDGAAIAVLVDGAIVQASIFASAEPIHLARHAANSLTKQATT
ncbi:MAG: AcrR family transcriptional regulator [Verrucomicrobiales bacterium]|jgi:AcrR family transcriptional regulator